MRAVLKIALAALVSLVLILPAAAQAKADTKDFVTLTMLLMGDPPSNGQFEKVQAEWNKYLKDKINANLVIKWVEWSDYMTKYNLVLASGETLDLVFTASDWLDFWPNVQRGAFMPLDKLLPLYAPKTWAEIPKNQWNEVTFKGQIWEIPENSYTQYVNHGLFYRGDWAKAAGLGKIKTFEDMGKYFQYVKDKKPGVIPWDVTGSNFNSLWLGYVQAKTDGVDTRLPTQLFWAPNYQNAFKVGSPVFDQTYIDYAKMAKAWNDAGYWRKDVLNFNGDTRAELRAGTSGADQHHTQTYKGLRPQMDKDQPGSDLQFFAWADTRGNLVNEPITHGATAISAYSKNPERAMMLFELLRQDKYLYQLVNYGVLGTHYIVNAKGQRDNPPNFNSDKDGYSISYWGGRTDKFEIPSANDYQGIGDIWKAFDKIQKPYPFGRFVFDKTPVDAQIAALQDVVNKYQPAINFGKVADPVAAVTDFRAKLKAAGYDKVLAEIQKQMDAYKKAGN